MKKIKSVALLFLALTCGTLPALSMTDSIRVSLLTCAPGHEVWANYGHTALRFKSSSCDLVFNYGLFSFDSPNFIWRFCTGETDYCVGAVRTDLFLNEYVREDRRVTEQVLDLNQDEAERLWNALCINSLPENRWYRYNFFYNNCATKVRDVIEDNLDREVSYTDPGGFSSMRDVVHHYTAAYPWTRFGISLLVGAPADALSSLRDRMFAPEIMMNAFATAVAGDRPLVRETVLLYREKGTGPEAPAWPLRPFAVLSLVMLSVAAAELCESRRGRRFWWLDGVIFSVSGIAAVIITFLFFFSEHPATSPNALILAFFILDLPYAVALCFRRFRESWAALHYPLLRVGTVAAAVVWALLAGQYLHPALLPLLLVICSRFIFVFRGHVGAVSAPLVKEK